MNPRTLLNRLGRRDKKALENFTARRVEFWDHGRTFHRGVPSSLWTQIKTMRNACRAATSSRHELKEHIESDDLL